MSKENETLNENATENTEVPAVVENNSDEGAVDTFDFAGFAGDDFEGDGDGSQTEVKPEETGEAGEGAEAGQEAKTGEGEKEVEPQQPADAGTAGQETPKPQPTQEVQTPPASQEQAQQQTPQDLQAAYDEWFGKTADELATKVYALDDATKEKLDTNPSEVIPQLAARLHLQVLTAATTQLANLIPAMLPQLTKQTRIAEEAEVEFYNEFPKLKAHSQDVDRIARAYVQANKAAGVTKTAEQAKREIGAMAMVALQIPFDGAPVQVQAELPKPVVPTSAGGAPAQPAAPNGIKSWAEEIIEMDD